MRVAFVVGRFPALSQTFIENQITGLIDRGLEVEVFSVRASEDGKVHEDVVRYRLEDRCHYFATDPSQWPRHARRVAQAVGGSISGTGRLFGRAMAAGRFGVDRAPVGLFLGALAMRRAGPFDAAICHFGPNGLIAESLRAVGGFAAPILTFFHGYDLSRSLQRHGPCLYERLFERGEWMLPISDYWRTRLVELGCPPEKARVHRMGIDTGRIRFEPRAATDGSIRILSIGRFVEKKGFEFGLRAFARIAANRPGARYEIVGDGPLRGRLEATIRDLGLGERVILHGSRTHEEVLALLKGAHAMLVPSVTAADGDQEGIPVVVLEAMAAGVPVVATRHTGIPEAVRDGETGLLAKERDVEGLAAHLAAIAGQPERATRLAAAARARVETEFDVNVLNDRLVTLVRDAAAAYRERA